MFEQSAQWHAHYFDQCIDARFKGVKVRLGRSLDDDVEVVRVVREHIGPELLIGVDSYWFHDVDTAIELTRRIAPYRIHFFEEPLPQYQIEGLERLQHSSPDPGRRGGARLLTARRTPSWPAATRPGSSSPTPPWPAGSWRAWRSPTSPPARRSRCIPHVGGPTVVGLAANLHWATAARVRLFEFDIERDQPMITAIGDNPGLALTDIRDGTLTAPTGPGLGVDVDEAELARYPYVEGETYAELFPEHESGRSAAGRTGDG